MRVNVLLLAASRLSSAPRTCTHTHPHMHSFILTASFFLFAVIVCSRWKSAFDKRESPHTDTHTQTDTHRHTDTQTHRHTDTHTHTCGCFSFAASFPASPLLFLFSPLPHALSPFLLPPSPVSLVVDQTRKSQSGTRPCRQEAPYEPEHRSPHAIHRPRRRRRRTRRQRRRWH